MILFILIASVFFFVPSAHANFSMTITPAFQELEVTPEEDKIVTFIEVTNETDITLMLDLFAVDFVQADDLGNVALVNQVGSDYRLADYIAIPESDISVNPGETAKIQVDILNKADLTLGGHYGAVVARTRSQDVGNYQQVLPAVSSLLLVHKTGGERYNLSLTDFTVTGGNWQLRQPKTTSLTVSNEGNIHLVPKGLITFTDLFDRIVYKGVINESSSFVLPQSRRQYTSKLQRLRWAWPVMVYNVEVSGSSNADTPFFAQEQVVVVSPTVIGGLLVVVIGGWWLGRRGWRKRNSDQELAESE